MDTIKINKPEGVSDSMALEYAKRMISDCTDHATYYNLIYRVEVSMSWKYGMKIITIEKYERE